MKTPHAIGYAALRVVSKATDADLAARAERVYSDDHEPKADRSALRAAWIAAVRSMGDRWILATPIRRPAGKP